jgi:outer membrane lipoprotein SlyB
MTTYVGGKDSEFILPDFKYSALPKYLVGDRNIKTEYVGTRVTWRHISGSGKIQAPEITIRNCLDDFKNFSLFGEKIDVHATKIPETLPKFSGDLSIFAKLDGFSNSRELHLAGARLFLDLMGKNFENSGDLFCRELFLHNCGVFKNSGRIETHGNLEATAREVFNVCNPVVETRTATSGSDYENFTYPTVGLGHGMKRFIYGMNWWRSGGFINCYSQSTPYDFYSIGNGVLRSHAGSIKLNGETLVKNEYSHISAANSFVLSSPQGKVVNRLGNIFANGLEPSSITAESFEESCCDAADIVVGSCYMERYKLSDSCTLYRTFNTSGKASIFAAGDLQINTKNLPLVRGSDLATGGDLICNTPNGTIIYEKVHQLRPAEKSAGKLFLNGRDIEIKGGLFLAGHGIFLTASGQIAITGSNGNVMPLGAAVDISVKELAQKMYKPLLTMPKISLDTGLALDRRLPMYPIGSMKQLFMGRTPNPLKKLVFDNSVMAIPMILSDMAHLLGTRVLNTRGMLALMEENAHEVPGNAIVPTQLANKPLLYFTIKDLDEETECAEAHMHITTNVMRRALTDGLVCENGPTLVQAPEILLDRALVSGTDVEITALKDPTQPKASGTIRAIASSIVAKNQLRTRADGGLHTNARINITPHLTGTSREYTQIDTADIEPMTLQAGKEIILEGAGGAIRGTIVKTKKFVDLTDHLTIGVNKAILKYLAYNEESHGIWGETSITHSGFHEIAAQSILDVETMLSAYGNSLVLESVIASGLKKLHVQKPVFRETVAELRSEDRVTTSSSGISFGKASISDPLASAWKNLRASPNFRALAGSSISSAAALLGSVDDANALFNAVASGINGDAAALIAGTLTKRLVNVGFSIGDTETTTVTRQSIPVPNHFSAEVIRLECPTLVELQGNHVAKDFIVETESFRAKDMVASRTVESKTEGWAFRGNILGGVVGAAMAPLTGGSAAAAVAGALSCGGSDVSQNISQSQRIPTTVRADRFILMAGDAHLTDTQIRARLVDAIVRNDLVIESIRDEFFSETSGNSWSAGFGFMALCGGIQNLQDAAAALGGTGFGVTDIQEIDRRINSFASLVGEEQFNLVVGGKLLARSAFYGKHDASEVMRADVNARLAGDPRTSTDPLEHIESSNIVHERVPEEHSRIDNSYTIPLGDLLAVASHLSPREELAKSVFEQEKSAGKSDKEAMQTVREVKEALDKQEEKIAKISNKIDETDKQFVKKLETSINAAELKALKEGNPVSKETQNIIKIAAKKARSAHTRGRTTIDLGEKKNASESVKNRIAEGSINACLGFYDERISFYDGLLNSSSQETEQTASASQKQRRNSIDMKVPTLISGLEDSANKAGGQFMQDARATRERGFKSAWVRGEVPEYLMKTGASMLVDDALPIVGRGVQKVDEWTGGAVSTVLGALDPATWGTGVRRGLRDGLGVSQKIAQNTGEAFQYVGEVGLLLCTFGGGTAIKGSQIATKTANVASAVNKTKRLAQFERIVIEGIGPYKSVGGHHPFQQALFKGHPMYNAREALAVSNERLAKYGTDIHIKITNEQRALQIELKLSGRPNTMQEQVRIACEAMERAGIPRTEARSITAQAFWDLRAQGVMQPTSLPWGIK